MVFLLGGVFPKQPKIVHSPILFLETQLPRTTDLTPSPPASWIYGKKVFHGSFSTIKAPGRKLDTEETWGGKGGIFFGGVSLNAVSKTHDRKKQNKGKISLDMVKGVGKPAGFYQFYTISKGIATWEI